MDISKNQIKGEGMRFQPGLYKTLTARWKFPLVLMLEPTHRCNLACTGCDRIRTAAEGDLTVEQCLQAARECGAPVVAVTGGEPLLYGNLKTLVGDLIDEGKFIYLCTNGTLTHEFIKGFYPHERLTLNFHLDGMSKTHDSVANRQGVFKSAVEAIALAKQRGFQVSTNTTVYKNADLFELEKLFELLTTLGVDGMLVSPGFAYQSVENDIFFSRTEIVQKFRSISGLFGKFRFMNTPLYMDFLQGKRELSCTPWGNPTYNPLGWKSPCYLVTDGYYKTYRELMERTDWKRYESGADPRCANCMVHGGYETTVMRTAFKRPLETLRLALWNMKG
jgi:hopanoid biosynthesis associated radical SAM protein HpnH